jgi:hypothetical protein
MSTETSEYTLPASVLSIIQNLCLQLNVSAPSPVVSQERKKRSNIQPEDDGWSSVRSFKSTVIEKKEGIEKTINDIKSCLNKMSIKNFDTQKNEIIQYIEGLSPTNYLIEIKQIASSIFHIASTNKFFSEIYANLYKILINKFDVFKEILDDFIEHFIESMQDIKYVSQNEDYDKYCKYNQENDARKATSAFITNLMINEVLAKESIVHIILQMQELIDKNIDIPDKVNEVEEITENLFIILSSGLTILKTDASWNTIADKIREFASYKPKEKKSLSSRAIFKFMDIVQKL